MCRGSGGREAWFMCQGVWKRYVSQGECEQCRLGRVQGSVRGLGQGECVGVRK